jgi:hypothetical protein
MLTLTPQEPDNPLTNTGPPPDVSVPVVKAPLNSVSQTVISRIKAD